VSCNAISRAEDGQLSRRKASRRIGKGKAAMFPNPYAVFNDGLFAWLGQGNLDRAWMDSYLAGFAQLPQPTQRHEWQQLWASKLFKTIPNLVSHIGHEIAKSGQPKAGDPRRFLQLWQHSERLELFNPRSLTTFTRTLLVMCPKDANPPAEHTAEVADLVARVCSSDGVHTLFSGAAWGAVAEATRRCRRSDLFRDIWAKCSEARQSFTPTSWGAFAIAAGDFGMPDLLSEIWSACERSRGHFNDKTWGALLHAAGRCEQADLLREMWRVRCDYLQAFLGACANAALCSHSPDLLKDFWLAARRFCSGFSSRTWGSFAKAAGRTRQKRLLTDLWKRWQSTGSQLDSTGWGSFANAAGRTRQGDLLKEIWDAVKRAKAELNAAALASFADAAWRCPDLGQLLRSVWDECQSTQVFLNSRAWGSFAKAAGRQGQRDLLRAIFDAFKATAGDFGDDAWGTFADAAGKTGNYELLQEIWVRYEGLAIPHSLPKLGGTFIVAAAKADAPRLLLLVFRKIRESFDFTRLTHWGALFHPLLRAARRCPDESVQAEILGSLRNPTEPAERVFELMRDPGIAPEPIDSEGGRFEGACRCLMRSLVDSFFWTPAEFQNNVRRVVEGIMSLPEDRRRATWARFLGLGQGSIWGCLASMVCRPNPQSGTGRDDPLERNACRR
jgi:hypothetical protein